MLLIPAIDIKDGQCVRLVQGSMHDATVYAADPLTQAERWADAGARRIHLVDLNGAVEGKPVNADAIQRIARAHPQIELQLGGGIRQADTAKRYLDMGVNYVVIGTRAVEEPSFITQIDKAHPGSVIAGIDVRDGAAATHGWAQSGRTDIVELAMQLADCGAVAIVYTDIGRDGMLSGVNVQATASLASQISIPVIASGGIRDIDDIEQLMAVRDHGILGAIAGKSLYEGTLDYLQGTALIERMLNDQND